MLSVLALIGGLLVFLGGHESKAEFAAVARAKYPNQRLSASFRRARSAHLRCAIAHRGVSRFPDVQLHIWGLVLRTIPQ